MQRRALHSQPNTGGEERQLVKEHSESCYGNNTRVLQMPQPYFHTATISLAYSLLVGVMHLHFGQVESTRCHREHQGPWRVALSVQKMSVKLICPGPPPRGSRSPRCCDNPLVGINQLASVGVPFRSLASDFLQRGQGLGPHIRKTCFDSELRWWVASLLPWVV